MLKFLSREPLHRPSLMSCLMRRRLRVVRALLTPYRTARSAARDPGDFNVEYGIEALVQAQLGARVGKADGVPASANDDYLLQHVVAKVRRATAAGRTHSSGCGGDW
jgi:hypothetical protein